MTKSRHNARCTAIGHPDTAHVVPRLPSSSTTASHPTVVLSVRLRQCSVVGLPSRPCMRACPARRTCLYTALARYVIANREPRARGDTSSRAELEPRARGGSCAARQVEPLSVPYASQASAPRSTHLSGSLSEFCGERPTRLVICFVNLPSAPEIEKLCFGEGGGSVARSLGTRSMASFNFPETCV